jgi:glycosyltransferase involved in cell wall biosynthesis
MRARLGWEDDAFVCLHAGNMGGKQGLEHVIEAARFAQAAGERIVFAFMGDGNARPALQRLAARYGLRNVRFLPLAAEADVPLIIAAADALLVHQRASVVEMALPSKLTAYFASGVPVIAAAATGSETWREVVRSSGGIVCAPEDPAALLASIRRLAHDPGIRAYVSECALHWARTELSQERALRAYEQFVASVLAAGGVSFKLRVPGFKKQMASGTGNAKDGSEWVA